MGLHSINNQCFHNIFCYSLSLKSYLYPSHYCTLSLGKIVLYYDPKVDYHTWEFAMFASIAVCVLLAFILIFSSNTRQDYSENVSCC